MIFFVSLMYPLDRRVVAFRIYSILHSSRKTAHLLQVGHATVAWQLDGSSRLSLNHTPKDQLPKPKYSILVWERSSFIIPFFLSKASKASCSHHSLVLFPHSSYDVSSSRTVSQKRKLGFMDKLAASLMTPLTSSGNVTNFYQKGDDLFL